MRKKLIAVCLSVALVAAALAGSAESIPAASQASANVFATFTQSGEQTAGVTYTVHDLYFDGYSLMLTITQSLNEPGYGVYSDVLGDDDIADITWEIRQAGDLPLGSYCEIELYDDDGKAINSPMAGEETRAGVSSSRTYCYRFLPDDAQETVRIQVCYGIMEKPGALTGEMGSIDLTASVQERAKTQTVQMMDNAGKPAYVDEVFIAQTEGIAGIYLFYTRNVAGACICPVAFVNGADEELSATPYSDDTGDPLHNRGFTYHAIRATKPLETLRVLDLHSDQQYLIDLTSGAVRKAE